MIVRESISFTRSENPFDSLNIGLSSLFPTIIEEIKKDYGWVGTRKEKPKSLEEFFEEDASQIDTDNFINFYNKNINNSAIKKVLDNLLEKIASFNGNKFYSGPWVFVFYKFGKEELIWNNTWVNENNFILFRKYDAQRTFKFIKSLGANKAFKIGSSKGDRDLEIWGIKNGATNLDHTYNKAIQDACETGDIELAKLLLADPNVDPASNTKEGLRYTRDETNFCIKRAAKIGHIEIVKLLLQHPKVDPSAKENFALRAALFNQDSRIVKLLISDNRVLNKISYMKDIYKKRLKKMEDMGLL